MKIKQEDPKIPWLVPKPLKCNDIRNSVSLLDGIWKVKHTRDWKKYLYDETLEGWLDTWVPSDMMVHRNKVEQFVGQYIYKKLVFIPREQNDCEYVLRFEGMNGFAKVYIDGQFVMEHENGFISFNKNITEFLEGKDQFILSVCVDETADSVSTFSHGGILHSVMLYTLPKNYVEMIHTTTTFDEAYETANLRIDYAVHDTSKEYHYKASLLSPQGTEVMQTNIPSPLEDSDGKKSVKLEVKNPMKWDAEHPWLYTLRLSIWTEETLIEEIEHRFGFRQINRIENQLFVNGQEVKLRGVCRHEISPLNGRCLTKELIEQDVELFKEANCNYIRTSHYPPSEYFLQLCDEKGIYVEDELALAFIARTLNYTQRDPSQTKRYLSHFAEVYARDYSHPCIIIWSLCNESFGGYNFDLLNRYAHRMDPTRPTKFSYPMTMQEEHEPIDIWSVHYSNLEEDLAKKCDNVSVGYSPGYDVPVIHDEFAHIPCYNRIERRRDPNVRNFWGESIKRFWDKIWNTKGALGGAIWAGIDETNIFNGGNTCLEWGIIDVWSRRKPEHYMTRKAYSPIVLPKGEAVMREGNMICVEIENRFCHTNLSELIIDWIYGELSGTIKGEDVEPREKGVIRCELPEILSRKNNELELTFTDAFANKVDEYLLPVRNIRNDFMIEEKQEIPVEYNQRIPLCYHEDEEYILIEGQEFNVVFAKETGLIKESSVGEKTVLIGGPYMNVPYLRLGAWRKIDINVSKEKEQVKVITKGSYGSEMDVTFIITISSDGSIETRYTIDQLYVKLPKQVKLRVGVDCGGLDELGVSYLADPSLDTFRWNRNGLWSIYPEDHIARCQGMAKRTSSGSTFGVEPSIPWAEEMQSYVLNGKYDVDYKGTNDFRSLKENINSAVLLNEDTKASVKAISDGSHSVRLEIVEPEDKIISDRDERISYYGTWCQMEDYSGSLNNTEMWSKDAGSYAECSFTGTGVVWYGPVDTIYGIARIYIDGEQMATEIDQRVNGVDFPGSAAGYDKKYGFPLYSIQGLENKEHIIRIEVTAEKAEDSKNCYIVIDYLRIISKAMEEPIRLIINNEYNYPHIGWGNYCKPPIALQKGYSNYVNMQLTNELDK